MYRLLIIANVIIAQIIFNKVYNAAPKVIDEEFHLPQGLEYCNFNFDSWDPKITTFPGLYIISALILGPLKWCSDYYLRYINFIAGLINLILFFAILKKINKKDSNTKLWWSAINIWLLPPLYFFNNLYYTDVVSLTFVLLMFYFSIKNMHFSASLAGALSILMRQTNVIWVGFVFGRYALTNYFHYCLKQSKIQPGKVTKENIQEFSLIDLKNMFKLGKLPILICVNLVYYIAIFIVFITFIIVNGGIVVGDKTAHVAVLHIPQIFYFSLFSVFFALPHFISYIIPFLKFVRKRIFLVIFTLILMIVVIYYNTLVHPYLLADNRHYTFYIWKRFYEKIPGFRYIMTIPYLFGFYSIIKSLSVQNDVGLILFYIVCTTIVLVLQKLIDVRYFIIPFVLLRLNLRDVTLKVLVFESIFFIAINFITLRIFFYKNIEWPDFDYTQKLIW